MKFWLIISAVVVSLLAAAIPIPGTDVWYAQFVSVMLFGFLLIAVLIGEMSPFIGIFFAYLAFSMVFITHQDAMAIVCLLQVGACLLMAKEISKFDVKQRKIVWNVVFGLLIFQIGWSILQHFNLDPIFKYAYNNKICDTVGFSGSHNQYGLFLAAASPAFFANPILLVAAFLGLILSNTFSALLGFAAASLFFFGRDFNKLAMVAVVIIFGLAFMFFTHKELSGKFHERFGVWKLSVKQVLKGKAVMNITSVNTTFNDAKVQRIVTCNPWFGFGFQRFFNISPLTQGGLMMPQAKHYFEHAHNDYVEALFDLGIIGFVLLLFALFEVCVLYSLSGHGIQIRLAASGLIAYGVSAISIYTVHTAYNGFFLCVLIGLFYAEVRDGAQGRK